MLPHVFGWRVCYEAWLQQQGSHWIAVHVTNVTPHLSLE